MDITKEHKEKICDTNKKVSYSQRGSISIKKADSDMLLDSNGIYFKVSKGEVVESAIFERKTRDCGGDVLRINTIRRFRKVGFDEWFSIKAAIGNEYWENKFSESSTDDAIVQFEKNIINSKDELPEIPNTKEEVNNNNNNNNNVVLKIALLLVATVAIYKIGIN
jgi:hypothetical protein